MESLPGEDIRETGLLSGDGAGKQEPPAGKDAQEEEPLDGGDTQAGEPPAGQDVQEEKPSAGGDTQTGEPPAGQDMQEEEPPAGGDTQTGKPSAGQDVQDDGQPAGGDIQAGKPSAGKDAEKEGLAAGRTEQETVDGDGSAAGTMEVDRTVRAFGLEDSQEPVIIADEVPGDDAFKVEITYPTDPITYGDNSQEATIVVTNDSDTNLYIYQIRILGGDAYFKRDGTPEITVLPARTDKTYTFLLKPQAAGFRKTQVEYRYRWQDAGYQTIGQGVKICEFALQVEPVQLSYDDTIGTGAVETTKVYDGTKDAKVLMELDASKLTGVLDADKDKVTLSATAEYDTADVGSNKDITFLFHLEGEKAAGYSLPEAVTFTQAGSISLAERRLEFRMPDIRVGEEPKPQWEGTGKDMEPFYYYKRFGALDSEYSTAFPEIPGSYEVKAYFEQTNYRDKIFYTDFEILSTVNTGSVSLMTGVAYQFDEGSWQVEGDSTVYAGGVNFYVPEEAEYIITAK